MPMPDPDSAPLNIQEITKNYEKYDKQIALIRSWLRSDTLLGQVLRVLTHRVKYPTHEYSSLELQVLLLLTLAMTEPASNPISQGASGRTQGLL